MGETMILDAARYATFHSTPTMSTKPTGARSPHRINEVHLPCQVQTRMMPTASSLQGSRLRILVYALNFEPELTGVGKYTGEMVRWLAAAGHDIRVITAPPYYPQWSILPGHRGDRYSLASDAGVRVRRVPIYIPRRPRGLTRLVHLASFAIASLPSLFRQTLWQPHVIWTVQPTLFCTPGVLLLSRISGARSWMHIQDFEVDAGFSLGVLQGKPLQRCVLQLESWLMRRFDRVSTISARMVELATAKGAERPVILFPNWVDVRSIFPLPRPNAFRARHGIGNDEIVYLYSGNMGAKQGLATLAATARLLVREPNIRFVFCGAGSYRATLETACAGLPNVTFIPLQPLAQLNELLNTADVHLLPQRADASDLVMPSKLTGMLASGRPVIAMAVPGSSLEQAVQSCGVVVRPEDEQALSTAILELAASAPTRAEMGRQARARAIEQMSAESILKAFEAQLVELCTERTAGSLGLGEEIVAGPAVADGRITSLDVRAPASSGTVASGEASALQ